jgi:hypothetical protein
MHDAKDGTRFEAYLFVADHHVFEFMEIAQTCQHVKDVADNLVRS